MSTEQSTITGGAPLDASGTTESSTSTVTDSSSVGTTPASTEAPAGTASAGAVQEQPTQEDDPLKGIPSADELKTLIEQNVPHAKSVAQLREALEKRNSTYSELENRFKVFEPVADRFTAPEELQSLVEMRESLLGWEKGPDGQLTPSTEKFVKTLDPARQNYLFADLADVTDASGQRRIDQVIQRMGQDPTERARIAQSLGLVEPSAVAPQWQATEEQLNAIPLDPANPTPKDKALQDIFRSLPYDEREKLATNDPDYIRSALEKEQLLRQLTADREQTQQQQRVQQEQFQKQIQEESAAAGDKYVDDLISNGLTTFHESVVQQCNFLAPLDPAQLPDGMTPEQAAAMNQQIAEANKAEAAQITAQVVALINPQTRRYMLPTLKEIGVVDDKLMGLIDAAAEAVGNNGRNYGHLLHQNGRTNRDYKPDASITGLNNEAQRNFKLLVHYANQVKSRLMEKRSQFFAMKATGHNAILNGAATSRPGANGGPYDPTTAATQQPKGWMNRDEIVQNFTR